MEGVKLSKVAVTPHPTGGCHRGGQALNSTHGFGRLGICFKDANKIGIQVHSSGKKGPTLLVANKTDVPKGLLDKLVGVDVEIKEEITFLGVDISIDLKSRYLKAALTSKA